MDGNAHANCFWYDNPLRFSPLIVDSLSIQYMNHGVKMNYAIPRACGSLCWAVFCVVVGLIADAFGANRILIFQIIVSFLFAFFAF